VIDPRVKSGLALVALLAACTPSTKQTPTPIPVPEQPKVQQSPPATSVASSLCDELQTLIGTIGQGFAPYRGGVYADGTANGTFIPIGFRSCVVEGRNFPAAEYVCRGSATTSRNPSLLVDDFDALDKELGACFAKASWYPANWTNGDLHTFAGGERRRLWWQTGALPKPALALKIEEDFQLKHFYLRMSIHAYR